MAELLISPADPRGEVALSLYCWPCRTVHELALPDIEKVIYALGAEVADGGTVAGEPSCLRLVLQWANDAELYREHVEQGIECREKSPAPEVAYVRGPNQAEIERQADAYARETISPAFADALLSRQASPPAGWVSLDEAWAIVTGKALDAERRGERS